MARPKRYESAAEKQKAWRERQKQIADDLGKNAAYVLGEQEAVVQTESGGSDVVTSGVDPALPWPINPKKSPRWGEGVEHYVAPTEEEKEAMNRREVEKSRKLREERKKR